MAKVICVLYEDPVDGYPKSYPRDDLTKIERYPGGQTLPTPKAIDFKPGTLLGSVSGELGLRKYLESLGHTLIVTSDKDGPNSVLERELPDAEVVISQPFWPAYLTAERIASFCAAVGETNPLYVDEAAAARGPYGGIIAPPAFVAGFRYGDEVFERIPVFRRGGLMAGIDFELEQPLRPGDSIRVSSVVKEIYEKTGRTGTMVFAVVRSTLINQKGEVVARIDHRMMNRPGREKSGTVMDEK